MGLLKENKLYISIIRGLTFILGVFIFVLFLWCFNACFMRLTYDYLSIEPVLLFVLWFPVTIWFAEIFSRVIVHIIKEKDQLNMFLFKRSIVRFIIAVITILVSTFMISKKW